MEITNRFPIRRTIRCIGRHPYDVSKSCTDLLTASYFHTYGLPVAIARCGNIYGGGDLNWSRIVPGTIRSFLREESPVIRSDGTLTRDYFYVEDAVAAYLTLAEQIGRSEVKGAAFNFSCEAPATVNEIVASIQNEMAIEDLHPRVLGIARAEITEQVISAARARTVLGWRPRFTLQEGLTRTIAWYRGYLAELGR